MLLLASVLGVLAIGAMSVMDLDSDQTDAERLEDEDLGEYPGKDDVVLIGTDAGEFIEGDASNNRITGEGGDDTLSAGAGDDEVYGMEGNDQLKGGDGNDTMFGGNSTDIMDGGAGSDTLSGENDNDQLDGGAGNDSLHGGMGDDIATGGADRDVVKGGFGHDTLYGGQDEDTLFGGWGDDDIYGIEPETALSGTPDFDEGDFLNGGSGDDDIFAGNDDTVTSGEGADDIYLGDWIRDGHAVSVLDYNGAEDSLTIIFDDSDGAGAPQVTVAEDPSRPGTAQILLDGQIIAVVPGAPDLTADQVLLEPASAARIGVLA